MPHRRPHPQSDDTIPTFANAGPCTYNWPTLEPGLLGQPATPLPISLRAYYAATPGVVAFLRKYGIAFLIGR